jgi:hypothetical protein
MTLEEIEGYRDKEKVYESVPEWTLKVEPLEEDPIFRPWQARL